MNDTPRPILIGGILDPVLSFSFIFLFLIPASRDRTSSDRLLAAFREFKYIEEINACVDDDSIDQGIGPQAEAPEKETHG